MSLRFHGNCDNFFDRHCWFRQLFWVQGFFFGHRNHQNTSRPVHFFRNLIFGRGSIFYLPQGNLICGPLLQIDNVQAAIWYVKVLIDQPWRCLLCLHIVLLHNFWQILASHGFDRHTSGERRDTKTRWHGSFATVQSCNPALFALVTLPTPPHPAPWWKNGTPTCLWEYQTPKKNKQILLITDISFLKIEGVV